MRRLSRGCNSFNFSILVFLMSFFSVDVYAQSRTWGSHDYHIDPSAQFSFSIDGDFDELSFYEDPDFSIAEALPSPLYDERFDSYKVVVIINKYDLPGEPGQTMRVYHRDYGLMYFWWVSTARAGKSTPDGYFRAQVFSSRHRSSLYNGAPMPWSVFFNGNIATHGTFEPNISRLGEKASAGCVRLEPQRAEELFHMVGHSGVGYVDRIGPLGLPVYKQGRIDQDRAYKALFIVKSRSEY